jgi:hypothetical protein
VADTLSCLPCSEACSIEDLFAAIQYDHSDDFLDVFIIISKYQLTDKEIQASLKRHLEKDDSHIMHKFKNPISSKFRKNDYARGTSGTHHQVIP